MKSYDRNKEHNNFKSPKPDNRNSLADYFRQIDGTIEKWVNHLISEIEGLHRGRTEGAGR